MFSFQRMMWLCLLLACVGSGWFSCQYFLVPHRASFTPDWQGAQWIQADDGTAPVAYFRDTVAFNSMPDTAYVTIEASQVFRLFVNGTYIGSNAADFLDAGASRAYMYDITSALQGGANVVAVRVANLDQQLPRVRAVVGIVEGKMAYYQGTGSRWLATIRSTAVFPRYLQATAWALSAFDASSWLPAFPPPDPPSDLTLAVNPLLYAQPLAAHWMSPGAGRQAYFIQRLSLPPATSSTWLRVGANGTATIFINGMLFAQWNGQPTASQSSLVDYFSPGVTVARRAGLVLGMYDISSYVHAGVNTIAVSVADPGNSAVAGLNNLNTAALVEVLAGDSSNHHTWITPDSAGNEWHASRQFVAGWTRGDAAALAWPSPVLVSRPGMLRSFYLSDSSRPNNVQAIPLILVCQVILLTVGAVLGLWLLLALTIMRRFSRSHREALETASLAYLPALSCEALLLVLSREPQLPQPFPYTWFWGSVLLILVALGYLLLCLNAWQRSGATGQALHVTCEPGFEKQADGIPAQRGLLSAYRALQQPTEVDTVGRGFGSSCPLTRLHLLRTHWALFLLILVAIPLIFYNLAYEPYWQDELTSFDAAKGILAHGYPALISGFIYPKGELYSYCLALFMLIFGDQAGIPRALSAIEYIASLPLLYFVGCYFFERRVALLATAMLALSPMTLVWGRQVRMYEQAQMLTIVVFYLFYRGAREPGRARVAYLAVACLVVDYLSHEEVFIILPALLIGVLLFSRDGRHRLPAVLYNKHWWFAAALGASVIAAQLVVVKLSHPPVLGTDASEQPFIQVNAENIPFYINLLFFPTSKEPMLVLNSILALCGCLGATRSIDRRVKYCTLFLV
ncbi:MAG: glycosyltransferase family 39 protein, partial [Chloroflexota bacterium]|nr:glycosyltransferase family 39 protein [Chloroflexota bacterium]